MNGKKVGITMEKQSIYGMTYDALESWLVERGEKRFRA